MRSPRGRDVGSAGRPAAGAGDVRARRSHGCAAAGRDAVRPLHVAPAGRAVPARIEAIDRSGPTLQAVIETNPDALTIADALDAERKARGPRGPLHGIPILIKDNIDTADRMMTTAGSLALEGSIAAHDAFIVATAARGGRGHPRQDEPERVGELPIDAFDQRLERTRRADAEPVRARSQPVRVELRHRRGDRRQPRGRSASAPRPTGRSSARRAPTAWSASSRRSVSSAVPASSRSRTPRTRPDRWREPSPTPRRC